jgi:hypothetical protein
MGMFSGFVHHRCTHARGVKDPSNDLSRYLLDEQGGVVELAVIGDHMRVRPDGRHEVAMANEFSDACERHAGQVEQAHTSMSKIMR